MSASVHTSSQTGTMTEKSIEITEGREMSASVIQGQNKIQKVYGEILKIEKEIEMKIFTEITKVRARISEALTINTPAKILGGLAIGTLLMASTALPIGTVHADDPASPLVAAAIDHTAEFEDLEGLVTAGSTPSVIDYMDEFGDLEQGLVAARSTSSGADYMDELGDLEHGPVAARSASSGTDYMDEFGDLERGPVAAGSTSAAIDHTAEFEDLEGLVTAGYTSSGAD